jgi:hypothetical protein
MLEGNGFPGAAKVNLVPTHHLAHPQGMDPDLPHRSLTGVAMPSENRLVRPAPAYGTKKLIKNSQRRSARGVDFVSVVGLGDFNVVIVAKLLGQ